MTLPRIYVAYPAPPEGDDDDAPLEIFQAIMSDGLTSRLHRSLVYEQQIAQSAAVRYLPSEISGQILVQATAAEGHDLKTVEAAVEAELERFHREPPTDEEITRVKNRIEANHFRQLARIGGFGGRADQLNHFNVFASNPELINTSLDKYLSVQREDILRVADTYLGDRQVRLRVLPEPELSPSTVTIDRNIMPPPRREPEFNPPAPSRGRLSNGLGLTVIEQRGMPIVAFGLMLNSGATADPESLPGLAGFTVQMLAEGTSSKSSQEIAAAFEFIGSRLSVDGRREYTLVSAETLSKHWSTGLELAAEILRDPTFPEHELERVRREHLTDLRRGKDEPNVVAEQLMAGLVYERATGYGHPIAGTESSVGALTRDDILRQFGRMAGPRNAELIVAGDVGMDEVTALAEQVFGGWTGAGPASGAARQANGAVPEAAIYLVDRPGAPQSVIRALQTTMPRRHPDYFGLTLANYAFGGQFSAPVEPEPEAGQGLQLRVPVVHTLVPATLAAPRGRVSPDRRHQRVRSRDPQGIHRSPGEPAHHPRGLDGAKDGLLRGYPASFERPGTVLGQLLQLVQFDLPDDYFQTVRPSIESVTLADVHRITQEWVRPGQLQILVVGDRETVGPGLEELGLPVVHLDVDGVVIE